MYFGNDKTMACSSLFTTRLRAVYQRVSSCMARKKIERFVVVGLLCAVFCSMFLSSATALPRVETEEFVGKRTFRGPVRRDMAEKAARTVAEVLAMDHAARMLAQDPDLHFAYLPITAGAASAPLSIEGLARLLYSTRVTAEGVHGFPPNVDAVYHVRLATPRDLPQAIKAALSRPDLIELYGLLAMEQSRLLKAYDEISLRLLPKNPYGGGVLEDTHNLQRIVKELEALEIYRNILPYYEHSWDAPQKAYKDLQRAQELAPRNPLVLMSLAEVLLQLDRPVAAMEAVGDVLRAVPNLSRAHDIKGTILLRQRLPSLAVDAFSKAIELAPESPDYYTHRGAAYLILADKENMCEDFRNACARGNCDQFEWGRRSGQCPEPQ